MSNNCRHRPDLLPLSSQIFCAVSLMFLTANYWSKYIGFRHLIRNRQQWKVSRFVFIQHLSNWELEKHIYIVSYRVWNFKTVVIVKVHMLSCCFAASCMVPDVIVLVRAAVNHLCTVSPDVKLTPMRSQNPCPFNVWFLAVLPSWTLPCRLWYEHNLSRR